MSIATNSNRAPLNEGMCASIAIPAKSLSHNVMPVHILLIAISTAWFGPLTSYRVVENAYKLPYIGVNAICLYANLSIFILLSVPLVSRMKSSVTSIIKVAIAISLFGCVFIALTPIPGENKSATTGLFVVGQFLIGIAFVLILQIQMNQSLIKASTVEPKDMNAGFLRSVTLSMTLSALTTGFLLAFVLSESVYALDDSYFTKASQAITKVSIVSIIQMILIIASVIYWKLTFKSNSGSEQDELRGETESRCQQTRKALKCQNQLNYLSFGTLMGLFFSTISQWSYIGNQYPFTHNQSRIFLCFYIIGSALAFKVYPHISSKPDRSMTLFHVIWCLIYVLTWGFILMFLAVQVYSVALISIFAFFNGFALIILTIGGPIELAARVLTSLHSTTDQKIYIGMLLSFGAGAGLILCTVGDKTHYFNRDTRLWVYIINGAVNNMLAILSTILSACHASKNKI